MVCLHRRGLSLAHSADTLDALTDVKSTDPVHFLCGAGDMTVILSHSDGTDELLFFKNQAVFTD